MAMVEAHSPRQLSPSAVQPSPPQAPATPPQGDLLTEEKERHSQESQLLSVGFNQDYGCFACGTATGFRIYNCEPFKETFRREFSNGGIGLVEMLFRCNILAVVGGGTTPRYPLNKVMIWDDHQSRCIGELSFRSDVRAVRLRRDRICVVLEHKIYLYNFADLKLLHQIETMANPKGLCCLSPASNSTVLACPGLRRGQVRVELYDTKRTRFIEAHDSALACFALTLDGTRLATASVKGTLIRVFNTADCTKLQELRRGADRADIFSIAFSPDALWLALSSDKGTVHVFALKDASSPEDRGPDGGVNLPALPGSNGTSAPTNVSSPSVGTGISGRLPGGSNPGSTFSFMRGVLPKYFSSEWSFAQYRLPEETRSIVAFGPQKNTLVVVGTDGSYHKCSFDPTAGGEMVRHEYVRFMNSERDAEEGS